MNRKILLSLSLMTAGVCFAAPLSPEEALLRLQDNDMGINTRSMSSTKPKYILNTNLGEPALYVFEGNETRTFMIVSADDATIPLLGYSDSRNFDADNIAPALQYWLDEYARQIEYIREQPSVGQSAGTRVSLPASWTPIEPLVKSVWNQNAPFNNLCPQSGAANCYTGCVATSMAQVMNYFKYPEHGTGEIAYQCESLNNKRLTMDLSETTFDWDNMLDSYNGTYNAEQATAVATLMKACGYSVFMNYSTGTSGAVSGYMPAAFINYFNYDKGVKYISRGLYDYSTWAEMIYDNLKNVGPVIYDGSAFAAGDTQTSIGHSFICDGYRDGYFHFNWGWSGSGDGYFLLDALSPSSLGIGAGSGGGFDYLQDVILGIQPPKSPETTETQNLIVLYGSAEGVWAGSQLRINLVGNSILGWSYQGVSMLTIDFGIRFEPVNNSNAATIYLTSSNRYNTNQTLEPGGYMPTQSGSVNLRPTFEASTLGLEQDVEYKATSVALVKNGDWIECLADHGSYNYFYITRKGQGDMPTDYEIVNLYPMQFSCESLSIGSDLYNGIGVDTQVKVMNPNDTELTRGVALALLDENDEMVFFSDSKVVSLNPGESAELNWTATLGALSSQTTISRSTPFYLGLYDPSTNTVFYKSDEVVTMLPNPGRPTFSADLSIENADYRNGRYVVENSSDFNVKTSIRVSKNIFSYPVVIWVATMSGNSYYKILSYPMELQVIQQGESGVFNTNINFPDAVVGSTYYIVALVNNAFSNAVGFVAQNNGAGVDSLVADSEEIAFIHDSAGSRLFVTGGESGIANVEIYSLNGMRLGAPTNYINGAADIDLSALGKGVVIVNATDAKGNSKSLKLAL